MDNATRVINGTWGQLWMDSELVTECYGLQAKYNFDKEKIKMCGSMPLDSKVLSLTGTGSIKMHKVNSRMAKKIGQRILDGRDIRFLIISKLADPDSYGAERVAIKNVSLDDLTLADWEAATAGKVEAPLTFTSHEYLDQIEPTGGQ